MSDDGSLAGPDVVAASEATGAATLVVGRHGHDEACRRLADSPGSDGNGIRVTTSAGGDPTAATAEHYDTGVYEGLTLSEAGVVVTDSIENVRGPSQVASDGQVVCVDGIPQPSSPDDRDRLFQFLHGVTSRVRDVDGECHVHLDADPAAPIATVLAPLFDDVVAADAEPVSGTPS